MPRLAGKREVLSGWLYDAAVLPAAPAVTTQVTFFQQPIGQAGKTPLDTNMRSSSGFLPGVKSFVIKSILLKAADGRNADDVEAVICTGYGEIRISDKPYPDPFPLWMIAGGTGVFESVRQGTGGAGDVRGTIGPGNIANLLKLHRLLSIPINTLEPFEVTFTWPGGLTATPAPVISSVSTPGLNAAMRIWLVFFGFLKRQVS
jgi:hypothetical protein